MKKLLLAIAVSLLGVTAFAQAPAGLVKYLSQSAPSDESFTSSDINFTSGGNLVRGFGYFPKAEGKHPAVILSHGYNSTIVTFYDLITHLTKNGYVCYTFWYPGGTTRGTSEGDSKKMSLLTERQNLEDAIELVRSWSEVDPDNVFLLGESMGGILSALAAADEPEKVKAIALAYPAFTAISWALEEYPDPKDIPDDLVKDFMGMPLGSIYYRDAHRIGDVYSEIDKFKKDVLLMHGTVDTIVPISSSDKAFLIYDNVEYHVVKDAEHGFWTDQDRADYLNNILQFFNRELSK